MNSGKKRFKIELEDAEGSKYNLSLEGNVSKEKIMKIVEFMDLINIESNSESNGNNENETYGRSNRVIPASVGDKIWSIVESKFPYGGFTSTDILELYEDLYNEPIKLSIISTYLSRYAERGRLIRTRQGKEWVYKMTKQQPMQAQPSSSASLDLPL